MYPLSCCRRVCSYTATTRQDSRIRCIRTDVTVSRGGVLSTCCGVSMLPRADRYILDHAKVGAVAMGVSLRFSDYRYQVWWQEPAYQADARTGIAYSTDDVVCGYASCIRTDTVESIGPILCEARGVCSIFFEVSASTYLEGYVTFISNRCVSQHVCSGRSLAGMP